MAKYVTFRTDCRIGNKIDKKLDVPDISIKYERKSTFFAPLDETTPFLLAEYLILLKKLLQFSGKIRIYLSLLANHNEVK